MNALNREERRRRAFSIGIGIRRRRSEIGGLEMEERRKRRRPDQLPTNTAAIVNNDDVCESDSISQ
jgi:hypothetical protein